MKTHKVIDLVYHESEGNDVFSGTYQECLEWKTKQGFGYQVVPMTMENKNKKQVENIDEKLNIPVAIIRCPVCKSEKIADISTYKSNGIYGPGSRSWKTSDMRSCEDCGVIFKPVKGNGL